MKKRIRAEAAKESVECGEVEKREANKAGEEGQGEAGAAAREKGMEEGVRGVRRRVRSGDEGVEAKREVEVVGGGERAEEGVENGVGDGGEERGGVRVGENMRHGENWRAAKEGGECVRGGGGRGRRRTEMAAAVVAEA